MVSDRCTLPTVQLGLNIATMAPHFITANIETTKASQLGNAKATICPLPRPNVTCKAAASCWTASKSCKNVHCSPDDASTCVYDQVALLLLIVIFVGYTWV